MSLTNAQYDSIMHEYDVRQMQRHRLIEQRKKEIYDNIPAYREIDNEIASVSIKMGMAALSDENISVEELSDKIEALRTRKQLLLTEAGYSINYLDPPYQCSFCKDTGFTGSEMCHCFRQAILDCSYKQTSIKALLEEENFDTLSHEYHTGEELTRFIKAEETSRKLVDEFGKTYMNILFMGTVGTGKSFLSNCIANELIKKGHSVIYFSAVSLFDSISSYKFQKGSKDPSENPTGDIYNCDLLVIDDLGSEVVNSFVCSELFTIINERHLRHKDTVISTNLSLTDLNERYSGRIFSRMYSYYEICSLSGNDIRVHIKRFENRK